jgi:hypothetical protein
MSYVLYVSSLWSKCHRPTCNTTNTRVLQTKGFATSIIHAQSVHWTVVVLGSYIVFTLRTLWKNFCSASSRTYITVEHSGWYRGQWSSTRLSKLPQLSEYRCELTAFGRWKGGGAVCGGDSEIKKSSENSADFDIFRHHRRNSAD